MSKKFLSHLCMWWQQTSRKMQQSNWENIASLLNKIEHVQCPKEPLEKSVTVWSQTVETRGNRRWTELGEVERMTIYQEVRDHAQRQNKTSSKTTCTWLLDSSFDSALRLRLEIKLDARKNWKVIKCKGGPNELLFAFIQEIIAQHRTHRNLLSLCMQQFQIFKI